MSSLRLFFPKPTFQGVHNPSKVPNLAGVHQQHFSLLHLRSKKHGFSSLKQTSGKTKNDRNWICLFKHNIHEETKAIKTLYSKAFRIKHTQTTSYDSNHSSPYPSRPQCRVLHQNPDPFCPNKNPTSMLGPSMPLHTWDKQLSSWAVWTWHLVYPLKVFLRNLMM